MTHITHNTAIFKTIHVLSCYNTFVTCKTKSDSLNSASFASDVRKTLWHRASCFNRTVHSFGHGIFKFRHADHYFLTSPLRLHAKFYAGPFSVGTPDHICLNVLDYVHTVTFWAFSAVTFSKSVVFKPCPHENGWKRRLIDRKRFQCENVFRTSVFMLKR